jgi:hypothetical protein
MTNSLTTSLGGDELSAAELDERTLKAAEPIYDKLVDSLKSDDKRLLKSVYPDFNSFAVAASKGAEEFYKIQPELSLFDAAEIIKLKHSIVSHIVNQLYWPGMFAFHLEKFKELTKVDVGKIHENLVESRFASLSDERQKVLRTVYAKLLDGCNRRAGNLIKALVPEYIDILPFIFGDKNINKIHSAGTETNILFENICSKFKVELERIMKMTDEELKKEIISFRYTFLSSDDALFVSRYNSSHGYMPMFFLLEKAILSPDVDRNDVIYSSYFGIGRENPVTKDDLGKKYGLALERIRQIVVGNLHQCKSVETVVSDRDSWSRYAFLQSDMISRETSSFDEVNEDEHLDCSFLAFIGLCLMFRTDMVIIPKCENVKLKTLENIFLVDNNLARKFDFSKALTYCNANSAINKTQPLKESLSDFVKQFSLSGDADDKIVEVLKYIITRNKDITVDGDYVIYRQNKLDKAETFYNILLSEGKPMHKDVLFSKFKEMFPDEKCKNSACMTRILSDDKRVENIGKTGYYTLSEWNYFSGTGVELITKILSESPVPLKAGEIIKRFVEYNPLPGKNTVYGHLSYAFHNKVIGCLEGDFYYLPSKHYDNIDLSKRVNQKHTAEEKLQMLETFIVKYNHFPVSCGDDKEQHLYKWYKNMIGKRIKLNAEQRKTLNEIETKYKSLPHSVNELTFKLNCEMYKAFISVYGRKPIEHLGEQKYARWFNSARRHVMSLRKNDNRKDYFKEVEEAVEKMKQ